MSSHLKLCCNNYGYNSNVEPKQLMKFHPVSSTLISFGLTIASLTGVSAIVFSSSMTAPAIAQEAGEPVTTTSTSNSIALAKHLRKIGAKVYAAYWCPHCHTQKQRFGKEAVRHLEIIECDRRGVKPQRQLCLDKKIRGFPTWEIDGKFYSGSQTLENLARISKFRGDI